MTTEKSNVSFKDFGPKKINPDLYQSGPYMAGVFMGECVGAMRKLDVRTDKWSIGMAGKFAVIPGAFDPAKELKAKMADATISGVGFMPEAFMMPILNMFDRFDEKTGEITKNENAPDVVNFAYAVYLEAKASSGTGYGWVLKPLYQPKGEEATDPLAKLAAAIDATGQLAAPETETTTADAEKVPANAKKK